MREGAQQVPTSSLRGWPACARLRNGRVDRCGVGGWRIGRTRKRWISHSIATPSAEWR
jgi:hypothetical protein